MMLQLLKHGRIPASDLCRRWMSSSFSRKTTVMSFGDGSHGALGLPSSIIGMGSDAYEPTPIPSLPPDVVTIAAGHFHSLAVTSEGHVWAWGRNNEGQLGRDPLSPRESWSEPKIVEGLNKVRVQAAFASGAISAAIGGDGSLWVWGSSKRGQLGLGKGITNAALPSKVETLSGEEIVKVSLGWGHALALAKNGNLFGWGYYSDGRIGNIGRELEISPLESNSTKLSSGEESSAIEAAEKSVMEAMEKEKDMPIIWEPGSVEELHGLKVADVACGLDHSLVLCCDGALFSGGSNIYGQLGRLNKDLGMQPVDIQFRPLSIASGLGHSLAVCHGASSEAIEDATSVVSWGWNRSSQLGREGPEDIPKVVEGLAGETPISVSGGRAHSLALTAKKEVWAWGCGKNGRLGLGSSADEVEPMLVEYLEGCEVIQAVAGLDHSLVLVAE
ncbi:ultraviolet-B receptor UVR8 [Nicotiana tomentosiformis]|uniref:ultraviolet-B receptor UVR8 n=1 Tax=Nicotiana tomentosiformis TaxID=4098 RepID=UPI00051C00CB|nr:secretion-regulating guanine nucleotide exchange factor [Nicotiana tomentosiformis]